MYSSFSDFNKHPIVFFTQKENPRSHKDPWRLLTFVFHIPNFFVLNFIPRPELFCLIEYLWTWSAQSPQKGVKRSLELNYRWL